MSEVRTAITDFVLSAIAGTAVLFLALFGSFFVRDAPEQISLLEQKIKSQEANHAKITDQLKTQISSLQSKLGDKQNNERLEQVRMHSERINAIGTLIANGNVIARTFEDTNNKDLIAAEYREWEQQVLVALSVKFDQGYVSQFSAVRGNGLMLLNHNIEGDGWYSLLQGKLVFLNAMLTEIRKQ